MIFNYICILLFLISIGIIINTIEDKKYLKMSFKESMNLFNVPFVTFTHNDINLRFLIDTGSNDSYLCIKTLALLKERGNILHKTEGVGNIVTGSGDDMKVHERVIIDLQYEGHTFIEKFNCIELDTAFNHFDGFEIHGILGSKFFKKYKYELDFNKLVAKTKHGKRNKIKE